MVLEHVLPALLDERLQADVPPRVFGTLHHHVEHRQSVIMAELVQQQADDGSRHAPEWYDIHDSVEAMLGVLHDPPHAQDSLTLHRRCKVGLALIDNSLGRQLPGERLYKAIELISEKKFFEIFYKLNPVISEAEFQFSIEDLANKYNQDIVRKAQRLSAKLNEPKDIKKIKTYIELINEYGYHKVKRTNKRVSLKRSKIRIPDISQVILLLKQEVK